MLKILHKFVNDILHDFVNPYSVQISDGLKILHENVNTYLITIWDIDCIILDKKLFKGTESKCQVACQVLINKNNGQRATYEIYTQTQ